MIGAQTTKARLVEWMSELDPAHGDKRNVPTHPSVVTSLWTDLRHAYNLIIKQQTMIASLRQGVVRDRQLMSDLVDDLESVLEDVRARAVDRVDEHTLERAIKLLREAR